MKRFLISTAAGLMIAGTVSLPAFAQQGRGGAQPAYPVQQAQGHQSRPDDRGQTYRAPDPRNEQIYRVNDRDDRRGGYDRNDRHDHRDRVQQISRYHDARTEWRDTRRNASWNDPDHNGYYIGRTWYPGQPSARDYRRRGFALGYRPWQRGDRLGAYNDRYRQIDYRDYRVDRPPQGYRWVQNDSGDLILAALVGGLIASVIINN